MDDRLLEDEGRVGRYSWRSAGEDGAKSGFDPMAVDGRAIWEAECAVEVEEGIGKIEPGGGRDPSIPRLSPGYLGLVELPTI